MRKVELNEETWQWLEAQPGGARKYIEEHVQERIVTERTTKTIHAAAARAVDKARKAESQRNGLNDHLSAEEEAELKEEAIETMRKHGWTRPLH